MGDISVVELMIKLKDALSGPAQNATTNVHRFGHALEKFEQRTRHFKSVFYAGAAMEAMAFGVGEALKGLAEPAIQFQEAQENLERATHLTTKQLAAFEEQATRLSDTWPRSAEEITEAQGNLVRILGSAAAAMQTVDIATEFSTGTRLDLASATNLLATAYENVGDKSVPMRAEFRKLADQLTVLDNRFGTSRQNGDMLVRSFARLSGVAKVAGVGATQLMAALGVLNKSGFAGGRGASDYLDQAIERLGQLDKDGIPEITKWGMMLAGNMDRSGHFHMNLMKTLENMRRANPARLQAYLKSLGEVGGTLQILIDRYGQVQDAVNTLSHSQGASYDLAREMNKGWHQQLEDLHNSYQNLERTLGNILVPLLIEFAHWLEPILEDFRKFAKAHTTLVKLAFVFGLVGTALLLLGGLAAIVTSALGALTATAALAATVFEAFSGVMATFDAIADANPLGLIVFAAAALAVIALDVYEHWNTVKDFFETLGGYLAAPFVWLWDKLLGYLKAAYTWGKDFIHAIVRGFESSFGFLETGLHKVSSKIAKYLPHFHAGNGPLASHTHTQVTRTVANALRPAPIIAAFAGMPIAAGAPIAAHSGAATQGGIHFHVHVEAGANHDQTAESMLEALRTRQGEFAEEVARLHQRSISNLNRTEF